MCGGIPVMINYYTKTKSQTSRLDNDSHLLAQVGCLTFLLFWNGNYMIGP